MSTQLESTTTSSTKRKKKPSFLLRCNVLMFMFSYKFVFAHMLIVSTLCTLNKHKVMLIKMPRSMTQSVEVLHRVRVCVRVWGISFFISHFLNRECCKLKNKSTYRFTYYIIINRLWLTSNVQSLKFHETNQNKSAHSSVSYSVQHLIMCHMKNSSYKLDAQKFIKIRIFKR